MRFKSSKSVLRRQEISLPFASRIAGEHDAFTRRQQTELRTVLYEEHDQISNVSFGELVKRGARVDLSKLLLQFSLFKSVVVSVTCISIRHIT